MELCNFSYTKLTMLYKHWRSDHPEYLTEMEQGVDPGNEQGEAEESAIPDSKEHHTY